MAIGRDKYKRYTDAHDVYGKKMAKLISSYREQEKKVEKIYRDYFMGKEGTKVAIEQATNALQEELRSRIYEDKGALAQSVKIWNQFKEELVEQIAATVQINPIKGKKTIVTPKGKYLSSSRIDSKQNGLLVDKKYAVNIPEDKNEKKQSFNSYVSQYYVQAIEDFFGKSTDEGKKTNLDNLIIASLENANYANILGGGEISGESLNVQQIMGQARFFAGQILLLKNYAVQTGRRKAIKLSKAAAAIHGYMFEVALYDAFDKALAYQGEEKNVEVALPAGENGRTDIEIIFRYPRNVEGVGKAPSKEELMKIGIQAKRFSAPWEFPKGKGFNSKSLIRHTLGYNSNIATKGPDKYWWHTGLKNVAENLENILGNNIFYIFQDDLYSTATMLKQMADNSIVFAQEYRKEKGPSQNSSSEKYVIGHSVVWTYHKDE